MTEPEIRPLPCFVCGELPKVERFLLMTGKQGWTALCPSKCFETETYYEREGAIEEWNQWVEAEGITDDLDEDEW